MGYSFGFSMKGLLVFLLPMLPNVFYFLRKNPGTPGGAAKHPLLLDVVEHGSQAVFILLLVFLTSGKESAVLSLYAICIGIVLCSYYVFWIIYFMGKRSLMVLLAMAVLPVAYFILAETWLHILPAVIPTVLFGIVHVIITYMDYHTAH